MKRTFQITLLVIMLFCSVAQSENLGPYIGYFKDKGTSIEYDLMFDFGIEQWEDGKVNDFRLQKWYLSCSYPERSTKQAITWCSLDRTVIDRWKDIGSFISTHHHYFSDGTL